MIFNYQIHISNVQLTAVCVEKDVPVTTYVEVQVLQVQAKFDARFLLLFLLYLVSVFN